MPVRVWHEVQKMLRTMGIEMRFRYVYGVFEHQNTVWVVPCPYVGNAHAYVISGRLKKIAQELFLGSKVGAAANDVYTAHGIGVLFKNHDLNVNRDRAYAITKRYRKLFGTPI